MSVKIIKQLEKDIKRHIELIEKGSPLITYDELRTMAIRLMKLNPTTILSKKIAVYMKKNSWDLFNDMFKIGQKVIIITDEDKFDWGTLMSIDEQGIIIKSLNKKGMAYEWDDITFMCEEGFPVRKLPPSPSDKYVEQLMTNSLHGVIRNALIYQVCAEENCTTLVENNKISGAYSYCEKHTPVYRYSGGHPWGIEDVESKIFNVGNDNPFFWWWNPNDVETIVMKSKDGAGGQLWGLSSIFEFENAS